MYTRTHTMTQSTDGEKEAARTHASQAGSQQDSGGPHPHGIHRADVDLDRQVSHECIAHLLVVLKALVPDVDVAGLGEGPLAPPEEVVLHRGVAARGVVAVRQPPKHRARWKDVACTRGEGVKAERTAAPGSDGGTRVTNIQTTPPQRRT
jgi:hypothetical protein